MRQNRIIYFLIIITVFGFIPFEVSANGSDWKVEFCKRLNGVANGELKVQLDPEYISGMETQALAFDSEIAIPAILAIWVQGEKFNAELFWWRQENRASRCFIMSLYLCATDEEVSWVPDFLRYIDRFNKKEKNDRLQEIKFISNHRSAIAKHIAESIKAIDIEKYNAEFKTYYGYMYKKEIGEDLPKWCK